MNDQFDNFDEINIVLNTFLTQQNIILEKLQNIKSKREEILRGKTFSIAINLETGQDCLKTKAAALARNKGLKAEFNTTVGKLRSKKCFNPAEDNLGIVYIQDIRYTRPRKGFKPYKRSHSGRFWCSSFRLNNNNLVNINGIYDVVQQVFEIPENLTWLDLSFNKLTKIGNEISQLKNLKIFYLHGNQFSEFRLVLPELQKLEYLYSLTLHGNPIEEDRNYRQKILSAMPRLKNLDFTNVTNADIINTEMFCLSKNN